MPKPIFIVGSGRSGTSAMTWAIGQHSNIIVTPETNWLSILACYMETFYNIGMSTAPAGHLARWNVSRSAFSQEFGKAVDGIVANTFSSYLPERRTSLAGAELKHGMQWFRTVDDPKTRWVDGTPSNTPYAIILAEMFPEGRFINLVRDPKDVVRSWLGISWRADAHANPEVVVDHIYHSTRCGYLLHAALGDERCMRVLFADVIARPEAELRRILGFLEEAYEPSCIEPIIAGKLNSSGPPSEATLGEFSAVEKSAQLQEMEEWLDSAQNPAWRIMEPEAAYAELLKYSSHKLLHPETSGHSSPSTLSALPRAGSAQNEFSRLAGGLRRRLKKWRGGGHATNAQ